MSLDAMCYSEAQPALWALLFVGRRSSIQRRGRRYLKSHWRNKDEHDYDEGWSHDILQGLGKGPANRFLARLAVIVRRLGCPDDVLFESRISRRCARSSRSWTHDPDRRRPPHRPLCRRSNDDHVTPGSQERKPS